MFENLNSDEKLLDINNPDENITCILDELIHDYEEELYSIRIQLKSYISQLEQKEKELYEKEQVKDNRTLFSAIYYNNSDNVKEIEDIKIEISKQKQKEEHISRIINALSNAIQYIKRYTEVAKSIDEKSKKKSKINDMGLSILEAQEIERQRIARDLHDTTVQNLTSMVHKAELCIKLIDIDAIRAKLELNTMSNTIKTVINDMRGIIYNLKPMTIEDLGLTVTVQRYASKLMDLNNIEVNVEANEEPEQILPVIKLTVFRVIQEACNNIIKHAKATIIDINIHYEKNSIIINVKDNGKGFDTEKHQENKTEQTKSFGLSIMKERISLLSGTLEVQSEKDKGTTVIITVPLTNNEEEKNE